MPIHQLVFISQKQIARQTVEYIFEKPENFNFTPGQYGGFTLINQETKMPITRRFSLLSTPQENAIRIATRIQPSDFKSTLLALQQGDTIKFAGPTGTFVLHDDLTVPAILIAGGIGITPFYSMILHNTHINSHRPITLFYGNHSIEDAAYLDELSNCAISNASFSLFPILQHPLPDWRGEKGFITASFIENYIDCDQHAIFYVCGSPSMINAMQQILAEIGISTDNIRTEDFPGY